MVTIFSQYGEPVDVNLPRDKQTGKSRGFGFVMYENQKSTILAVDNLNGAKILGRTIRVDHVSKYKHLEKGHDGKYKEAEMESMNARPELFASMFRQSYLSHNYRRLILHRADQNAGSSSESEQEDDLLDGIDPDDPMAAYLIQQRKEERALGITNGTCSKKGKKSKRSGDSKEERRARKEEKRLRKMQKAAKNDGRIRPRSRSPDGRRYGDRSRDEDDRDNSRRQSDASRRRRSPSPPPRGTREGEERDRGSYQDRNEPLTRRAERDGKQDYRPRSRSRSRSRDRERDGYRRR